MPRLIHANTILLIATVLLLSVGCGTQNVGSAGPVGVYEPAVLHVIQATGMPVELVPALRSYITRLDAGGEQSYLLAELSFAERRARVYYAYANHPNSSAAIAVTAYRPVPGLAGYVAALGTAYGSPQIEIPALPQHENEWYVLFDASLPVATRAALADLILRQFPNDIPRVAPLWPGSIPP